MVDVGEIFGAVRTLRDAERDAVVAVMDGLAQRLVRLELCLLREEEMHPGDVDEVVQMCAERMVNRREVEKQPSARGKHAQALGENRLGARDMLHRVVHDNRVDAARIEGQRGGIGADKAEALRMSELFGKRCRLFTVLLQNVDTDDLFRAARRIVERLAARAAADVQHGLVLEHIVLGIGFEVVADGLRALLVLPHCVGHDTLVLQVERVYGRLEQLVEREQNFCGKSHVTYLNPFGLSNPNQGGKPLAERRAERVQLVRRVGVRKAYADCAVGGAVGEPVGGQRAADFFCMGGARRAAGDADALAREKVQHRLAFDVRQGQAHNVRHGACRAVDFDFPQGRIRRKPVEQVCAERFQRLTVGFEVLRADGCRRAEARNADDILRACAQPVFLLPAVDQRDERAALQHFGRHIERRRTLRSVDLVRADRDEVCAERARRDRDFQKTLYRVAVADHVRAFRLRQAEQVGDGVERAGLIVDQHRRDEHRVFGEHRGGFVHVERTVLCGQAHHIRAERCKVFGCRLGGGVFPRRENDARARAAALGSVAADQREVVCLAAAAAEDELPPVTAHAERRKHIAARRGDDLFGGDPRRVQRGRIAIGFLHHLLHRIGSLGAERGGRAVVKIDHASHALHHEFELRDGLLHLVGVAVVVCRGRCVGQNVRHAVSRADDLAELVFGLAELGGEDILHGFLTVEQEVALLHGFGVAEDVAELLFEECPVAFRIAHILAQAVSRDRDARRVVRRIVGARRAGRHLNRPL